MAVRMIMVMMIWVVSSPMLSHIQHSYHGVAADVNQDTQGENQATLLKKIFVSGMYALI